MNVAVLGKRKMRRFSYLNKTLSYLFADHRATYGAHALSDNRFPFSVKVILEQYDDLPRRFLGTLPD